MSDVQLLVFRLEGRDHAVYLRQVDRVVRAVDAAPLPNAPAAVLGMISVQGHLLALLSLRRRLGLVDRPVGVDDQFIIAQTSWRSVALAVDGVVGVVKRPAEEISRSDPALDPSGRIEGMIQLDGELTLIHDLDRFFSIDEELALDQALVVGAT